MKIGIFLGTQISPHDSLAQQVRESAEQVRAAHPRVTTSDEQDFISPLLETLRSQVPDTPLHDVPAMLAGRGSRKR